MPVIRKFAVQGHDIPSGYTRPLGPFPPEVLAQNPRSYGSEENSDSLHEALDNIRMFRCKECSEILYEDELDAHECGEEGY